MIFEPLQWSFSVIKTRPLAAEKANKKNTGTYRILHRLDPGLL
jgi:hypothetical protein